MNGKKYLILGASSDIAQDLIGILNLEATDIVLAHYNRAVNKINDLKLKTKAQIIHLKADFSIDEDINKFIDYIVQNNYIPTHIVHLPAHRIENKRHRDLLWQDYQMNIDVQLKSIVQILAVLLPKMSKEKFGKIVFLLSSCTQNIPPKFLSSYVTAKYALLGFMKSIAIEYADKNISINAVSPSMIETGFLSQVNEKIIESNAASLPLKRNAKIREVTPYIRYLLSEEAGYVTGTNLVIAGGSCF